MKEEWRDIFGFEGRYQVSNTGKVRGLVSANNGRKLFNTKPHELRSVDNKGYRRVVLLDDSGKRCNRSVHRLVAAAFIGDCTDMQINHKDGNKTNNNVENLEICDQSYNTIHAYKLGLMKPCNNGLWKAINVIKDGVCVASFASIREMCRTMRLDRKSVQRVLNGVFASHHGYKFSLQ